MSTRMATTPISGERVLSLPFMASVAYVAAPISRLVGLEMVEALRPALRHWSGVAVMRIKPVVNMSVKAVRAVKPRTGAQKHSAHKPIGPVVAVRGTVIRGIVEVSVRTHGSYSDVYANRNLSLCHGCAAQKASYENGKSKRTNFQHGTPFVTSEFELGQLSGKHNTKHQ
jgi:hypothetical protein